MSSIAAAAIIGGGMLAGGIGGSLISTYGSKGKYRPYGAMNPDQQQMSKALGPYLQNQIGASPEMYSGQLTAPMTGGEQQIVGSNNRLAAMSEGGLAALINPDISAYNKQFDEQVANPQYSSFRQNVLPGLQESMPTFSTAMGAATQRGYNDVTNNLAQQRYQGWQDAQNRRLQAITGGAGAMNQYAQTAAIPRLIEQAGLGNAYNEWTRGQTAKSNSVAQMLNFLGLSSGTLEPNTMGQNVAAGAGAGASAGLGAYSAIQQSQFNQQMLAAMQNGGGSYGSFTNYPSNYFQGAGGGGAMPLMTMA